MKDKNQSPAKEAFCRFCHLLYQNKLVSGVGGNLSARSPEGILLTPTGYSLRDIREDMVATVDEKGSLLDGPKPTKDMEMHLGILRVRAEVNVVCHVHGADLIAASCMMHPGPDVLPAVTPGFVYYAHPLTMIPFMVPGSNALTDAATAHFSKTSSLALLMQNHGLVTVGKDFDEALNIAEEIDEAVKIFIHTNGSPSTISSKEVMEIKKLRDHT
ncbi:MAG: class II aldolase/adducin family protein [Deltaproteobacteria bacterium]|nr:class II aldolase/adducin family protein [Deltaproteobacteria bacterium]